MEQEIRVSQREKQFNEERSLVKTVSAEVSAEAECQS
jgi:hypothetical protein